MSLLKEEEIETYRRVGKIAAEVMRKGKKLTSKGKKLLSVCEIMEREIVRLGAKPAFPLNISVNQIAAHYTSPADDRLIIPERAIVKLDLGAQIDGYISDHARTFLVGPSKKEFQLLKQTAELALEKALEFNQR
ncbi:MAG: M24 family metallopeptidase [Candidatus Heimdallarchaeota archaeon]